MRHDMDERQKLFISVSVIGSFLSFYKGIKQFRNKKLLLNNICNDITKITPNKIYKYKLEKDDWIKFIKINERGTETNRVPQLLLSLPKNFVTNNVCGEFSYYHERYSGFDHRDLIKYTNKHGFDINHITANQTFDITYGVVNKDQCDYVYMYGKNYQNQFNIDYISDDSRLLAKQASPSMIFFITGTALGYFSMCGLAAAAIFNC